MGHFVLNIFNFKKIRILFCPNALYETVNLNLNSMIELKIDEESKDWSVLLKKCDVEKSLIAKRKVNNTSSSTKFVLRIVSKSTFKLSFETNARYVMCFDPYIYFSMMNSNS